MLIRIFAAAVIAAALLAARVLASDPNVLWQIVHGQCVPGQQAHNDPAPCAEVSLTEGWAVLKDRIGATQFLLIPTARVTGIEDPAVLAPDAPNYWQAAWAARRFLVARAGRSLPRDVLSLAVNAPTGRSQNQLHIHIDCLRADVREILRVENAHLGPTWAPLERPLVGHRYIARRLDQADLSGANPFRLLAAAPQLRDSGLDQWTLVVAGTMLPDGEGGFILLANKADLTAGDRGNGEELQDHDCAVAHQLPN